MTKDEALAEILRIWVMPCSVADSQMMLGRVLDQITASSKDDAVQDILDLMGPSKDVGSVILYCDGSCTLRNKTESIKWTFNNIREMKSFLLELASHPEIKTPEEKPVAAICVNCRFYGDPLKINGTDKVCRRHAPVYIGPVGGNAYPQAPAFPLMDRNDWCGDWEKKEGV